MVNSRQIVPERPLRRRPDDERDDEGPEKERGPVYSRKERGPSIFNRSLSLALPLPVLCVSGNPPKRLLIVGLSPGHLPAL